jgi:GTP1/Obg family GTP-binding protein
VSQNKFEDILTHDRAKEQALSILTAKDKQFIEEIDQEYYRRVQTSDDYYKRKRLILQNLDRLQRKVESTAKNLDDFERLRFIMLEKARQKRSILRNFSKKESEGAREEPESEKEEEKG